MEPADKTYQCPDEPYRISRSVHLGRLANFYAKCRDCPHREDTGPLSSRTIRQLQRAQQGQDRSSLFFNDGVRGVYLNQLHRGTAKELGEAFGRFLASQASAEPSRQALLGREPVVSHDLPALRSETAPGEAARLRPQAGPVAVVGHDDRLSSPDLSAGVVEGLRAAGSQVVSIGAASGACLRYAVRYLEADGAVHVTGGAARRHVNGMRFYGRSAIPLTRDHGLSDIIRLGALTTPRRRRAASLSHFHVETAYHAGLLKFFHALRPLRVRVTETTTPVRRSLERLLGETPCTLAGIPSPSSAHRSNPTASPADLGLSVDEDDRITFFDERNHPVPADQACLLLGHTCLRVQPDAAVVLAEPVPHHLSEALQAAGAQVHVAAPDAAELYQHMQRVDAVYGAVGFGDSDHRLHHWFHENVPVLDPVRALAAMLAALSTSDRPLSGVLPHPGSATAP